MASLAADRSVSADPATTICRRRRCPRRRSWRKKRVWRLQHVRRACGRGCGGKWGPAYLVVVIAPAWAVGVIWRRRRIAVCVVILWLLMPGKVHTYNLRPDVEGRHFEQYGHVVAVFAEADTCRGSVARNRHCAPVCRTPYSRSPAETF